MAELLKCDQRLFCPNERRAVKTAIQANSDKIALPTRLTIPIGFLRILQLTRRRYLAIFA